MRVRTVVISGLIVGTVGIGTAALSAAPESETFTLQPGITAQQKHTASTYFAGSGTAVTVAGTITAKYGSGTTCVYDAFYNSCGPAPHGIQYPNIQFGTPGSSNTAPWVPPYGVIPAYRDDHTYAWNTGTTGRLYFWAVPNGRPMPGYTYSGGFTMTLTPNEAPPATQPTETKTYPAPDPGKTKTYPIPPPGAHTDILDGTIDFVDADGHAADGPFGVAVDGFAGKAQELCWILLLEDADAPRESYPGPGERFGTCLVAVVKILTRYEELHARQGQTARTAAAKRCVVFGNARARKLLRFTCRATAAGARFKVRPKRSGTRLSHLLRVRAPKLIVRRSSHDKSGTASTKVRWR